MTHYCAGFAFACYVVEAGDDVANESEEWPELPVIEVVEPGGKRKGGAAGGASKKR